MKRQAYGYRDEKFFELKILSLHDKTYAFVGWTYNKLYTLRLTGDYNDHYNLEEEDVLPLVSPAEELIAKVTSMAKQSLENE